MTSASKIFRGLIPLLLPIGKRNPTFATATDWLAPNAGLTGVNWNVSGNVLPGPGPIRTLRMSVYSNDFTPLSGSGTLFELKMTRVSQAAQGTLLIWAPPPDQFIFIDADLETQKPGNAAPGSVTSSAKRQ